MTWSILLLPLLGGYYFLTRSISTRHRYRRLERQRLIFDSLINGFIFLLITYVSWSLLKWIFPSFIDLLPHISIEIDFLYPSLLAFLLAIVWTKGLNFYKRKFTENVEKSYLARAIENTGNSMQKDLLYSHINSELLMITLRNGIVYVGLAIELDEPEGQSYIRILPFYRGYLNQQQEVILNKDYLALYQDIESAGDNTGTVIYEEDIITTTLYEYHALDQFNQNSFSEQP